MDTMLGPERPGGQGLDEQQEESGNRAILALLSDPEVRDQVDLVITYRGGAYEIWSARGMVRFRRLLRGGRLHFEVIEEIGHNPVADQRHTSIASCEEELRAAAASGFPTEDANLAFIESGEVSYPFAYERIAQLFDSPFGPDLVISPKCYAFGLQRGQHGALDVVQSRAPLAFAGPGIRPGRYDSAPRHVDIAPTICRLMGFPTIDGKDSSGRKASQRGKAPDVYLKRQDGAPLDEIIDGDAAPPQRAYMVLYDGLSNSELRHLLERDDPAISNLRRLLDRSAMFTYGSTVNFPSITWPSHSTIMTGAWCGHHDIVNPTYYDRALRQPLAPQGQGMMTESYLGGEVETLYEAFARVLGPQAFTANIHEPQGRGAHHAALEQRVIGPRDRLRALTGEFVTQIHPRYAADQHEGVYREALLDARGMAQVTVLFDDSSHATPVFVAHEMALTDGAGHDYGPHGDGLRTAIAETDRRLGQVLDMLEAKGLLEGTLFIFTSDHGMASQDITLRANPARHPERIGMKTVTGEPMIWLRDMAVTVEPAPDGRTARIIVLDNDADSAGENRPVEGAEVIVSSHSDRVVARVTTNAAGVAGFVTPPDVSAADIAVSVRHSDYNPRHLRLDGRPLGIDLRRELYGERSSMTERAEA
ncbi:MAG TPA: alkaline phosphatase family protein [Candidatus Acidoferrales bacterium]|nr:alkaline phosphatase family protein [Candidatus Acidoferrales bacterium]